MPTASRGHEGRSQIEAAMPTQSRGHGTRRPRRVGPARVEVTSPHFAPSSTRLRVTIAARPPRLAA